MAARKSSRSGRKITRDTETPMVVEPTTIDTTTVKIMGARKKIALLLAFVIIVAALYLSRGLFIAATVNGEVISRPTVIGDLEKHYGKQSLDSFVTDALINQEAKNKGVTVSDDEINGEYTNIENSVKAQGQDINALLTMQGMTPDDLKKQIRTQKVVEKLLGDKINPSDKEIEDYTKNNKDLLPKDKSAEEVKEQVRTQLKQQKLGTEFQTWLAEIKKNANIKYYVSY